MGGYVLPLTNSGTKLFHCCRVWVWTFGSIWVSRFGSVVWNKISFSTNLLYFYSPCYTTELTPGEQIRDRKIPRSQLFYRVYLVCVMQHTHIFFVGSLIHTQLNILYTQARQRCVFRKKINKWWYSIKDLFVT